MGRWATSPRAGPAGNSLVSSPWNPTISACSRHRGRRAGLEVTPSPAHAHDRAALRKRAILVAERRTRAFEQRLRNEDTEAEPATGFAADVELPPPLAGDIGLADPVHNLRRKARPIVGDGHADLVAVPARRDVDALAREVDGVLHQVAKPV